MSGPLKWEWLLAAGFALVLTHTTASAQDTGSSGVICGGDECITHNGIEDLEERARAEPNNPTHALHVGSFYWDKAFRDAQLSDSERRYLTTKGQVAIDRALALNPEYGVAMVFKGLLLTLDARFENDPESQRELLRASKEIMAKGRALIRQGK